VCKLAKPDGSSAEVSAQRLRDCDAAAVRQIVRELADALETPAVSDAAAE
jgi:hypothetical protein